MSLSKSSLTVQTRHQVQWAAVELRGSEDWETGRWANGSAVSLGPGLGSGRGYPGLPDLDTWPLRLRSHSSAMAKVDIKDWQAKHGTAMAAITAVEAALQDIPSSVMGPRKPDVFAKNQA